MSQRQLASAAGLQDSQSISNYERGITEVPAKRLRRIADATKKPLEFFVRTSSQDGDALPGESELAGIAGSIDDLARAVQLLVAEQSRQADEIVELRQQIERLPRTATGNGEH